jgi:UDP-N-acetylglucosamine 2-epimerase (non-hydrolysing)
MLWRTRFDRRQTQRKPGHEGIPDYKVKLVGNIMIDTLVENLGKAHQRKTLETLGLKESGFVYVTLHRPSNVDSKNSLAEIIIELKLLSKRMPVVFPMHQRTRQMLCEFGISVAEPNGLKILDPIGYHDSLNLTACAPLSLPIQVCKRNRPIGLLV